MTSLLLAAPVVVTTATAAADPIVVAATTVLADGRAATGDPLKVTAVDVSGGKVAWIDNSRTGTPYAAWKRTITGVDSRSLVLDRATGISIAQYGDAVLALQERAANPLPVTPNLVRIQGPSTTTLATATSWSHNIGLNDSGQYLLADRFNGPGSGQVFRLGNGTSTSLNWSGSADNSSFAQSEKWIIESDASLNSNNTTIIATNRATGDQRTVGTSAGLPVGRPAVVAESAVWSTNDHIYWVSLTHPETGVQNFSLTHATLVTAHGNRFAASDWQTDIVGIYTIGQTTPDFTVTGARAAQFNSSIKTVDFDYSSIAWVRTGPDGDQLVSAAIPGAKTFTDVAAGAGFAEDIAWLASTGITSGYADGTFRPSAPITRQAMAAFLYRFQNPGQPDPVCQGATRTFPDVAVGGFCGPIEWLAGTGITSGYADGTFRPSAPITRQAMAAFLFRALNPGQPDPVCQGTTRKFPDVPAGGFCGPIEWLSGTGITSGYADGTFHPSDPISRQAMAAFLHRAEGQ